MSEQKSGEKWRLVPVPAEEQEARARTLAPCRFAEIETAAWKEHVFAPHFRVLLPPEFALQLHLADEQALWADIGGSLFLMTRHAGDGLATSMIGFDAPAVVDDETVCRVEVAGRSTALSMWRLTLNEDVYYAAALDAGLRAGLGVGVVIHAGSSDRRAELIGALGTIAVLTEAR